MSCDHNHQNGLRFCQTCGIKLDNLVCNCCGFSNGASSLFCGMCGTALSSSESSNTTPTLSKSDIKESFSYRHNLQKPKLIDLIQHQPSTTSQSDQEAHLDQNAIDTLFKGKS